MDRMRADLHLHTKASDGALTPAEVVAVAEKNKLRLIAITDHDTIIGVNEAKQAASKGLKVLCGVELSTYLGNRPVHILGYNIDDSINDELEVQRERRIERNLGIVEKLNALGICISYDEVLQHAQGDTVGRPHIGAVLVEKGICSSLPDAFKRYLDENAPAFVKGDRITPEEGVRIILEHGGAAVLAHPKQIRLSFAELSSFVEGLKKVGLSGIEGRYFAQTELDKRQLCQLASVLGLCVTGGSDFHNADSPYQIGNKYFYPKDDLKRLLRL